MPKLLAALPLLVLALTGARCPAAPPDPAGTQAPRLTLDALPADTALGFIGDSITHMGGYHKVLQVFFATRYPGRGLWTINYGASGENSEHGLRRLDWDVLGGPVKPDVLFIHFGMNDVRRNGLRHADPQAPPPAVAQNRQRFATHLRQILAHLHERGVRAVVLSPTPYDDAMTQLPDAGETPLAALELRSYTALARDLAAEAGVPFIDLHTPLERHNLDRQAHDPTFSLIRDRVHPNAAGHLLMAHLILEALQPRRVLYEVTLDAAAGQVIDAQGAQVQGLEAGGGGLRFELREQALPFPVTPLMRGKQRLEPPVDMNAQWNRQLLRVRGLGDGRYVLKINGAEVGDYSAAELDAGVELGGNPRTPQHQAALRVETFVDQQKDPVELEVRAMAVNCREGWMTAPAEQLLTQVDSRIAELKARNAFRSWASYSLSAAREALPRRDQTLERIPQLRRELRELPGTLSFRYELNPQP